MFCWDSNLDFNEEPISFLTEPWGGLFGGAAGQNAALPAGPELPLPPRSPGGVGAGQNLPLAREKLGELDQKGLT